MMSDAFTHEKQLLISHFTAEIELHLGENNIDFYFASSALLIKLNPVTVDDMNQFTQQAQLYYLMRDLK
jgi:hypothetical protein